ncbi:MAG: DUF2330 domain-containing protein [Myxococcales bacterium]|nr:DUF2330 domain-containing protein [Myxococcales bacterium]
MFRRTSVALTLALGIHLSAPDAAACGGMIGKSETQQASMNAQRVLIAQGAEGTAVVVGVGFDGASGDQAFVLPLQQEPIRIEDAKRELFPELERFTEPQIHIYDPTARRPGGGGGCGCMPEAKSAGAPGAGAPDAVRVVQRGETATYQYVVVGGSSGQSIGEWLNKEQFPVPAAIQHSLDGYAQRGWVFLAARVQPKANSGELAPITVRFAKIPPEKLEYPFALSSHSVTPGLESEVLLFLAGASPMLPKNYPVERIAKRVRATSANTTDYGALFAAAARKGAFVLEAGFPEYPQSILKQAGVADLVSADHVALVRLRSRLGGHQLHDMTFRPSVPAEIEQQNTITVEWNPKATQAGFGLLLGLSFLRRRARRRRA